MTDSATKFDAHFQGLLNSAQRQLDEDARVSISSNSTGWTCTIYFERLLSQAIKKGMPTHTGSGDTPTGAFEAALAKALDSK